MSDDADAEGLRERITKQGEDTLGKMAEDLLANPLVSAAIQRAFDAREKATAAQEAAFGALNIPTAADIERLTRRVRSVSQRLEGIEDGIDRLDERLAGLPPAAGVDARLERIDAQLDAIVTELNRLREAVAAAKPDDASKASSSASKSESSGSRSSSGSSGSKSGSSGSASASKSGSSASKSSSSASKSSSSGSKSSSSGRRKKAADE